MNKITVKGSTFAGLIKDLQSKVTLHEGVNLDENVFQLVRDDKGVVYLRGIVRQPSYTSCLCRNISEGDVKEQDVQADEEAGTGRKPLKSREERAKSPSVRAAIDANAVAGEWNECYSLSNSQLRKMLQCIGDDEAVILLDGNGLAATVGGAKYKLQAKMLSTGIFIPTYTVLDRHPKDGSYYPLFTFEVKPLLEMLETVLPLSKATSRSPMLKGRAIHIVLEQGNNRSQVTFESVSSTAGIRCRRRSGFTFTGDIDEQSGGGSLHLAIDRAAAESLHDIVKGEGKMSTFAWDAEEKNLIVWCGSHTLIIPTQDVAECVFPENEMTTGIDVDRLQTLAMLGNVVNTGSSTVCVTVMGSGFLAVNDPEYRYSASIPGSLANFTVDQYRFTLPVSTLIAVVKSMKSKFMNMYFDEDQSDIALSDPANGIDGTVMKL